MKQYIVKLFLIISIFLTVLFGTAYWNLGEDGQRTEIKKWVIDVNEIGKLHEMIQEKTATEEQFQEAVMKLQHQIENSQDNTNKGNIKTILCFTYIGMLLLLFFILAYLYCKIIRPFQRLETYAEEIAKGNFDISLNYERTNLFGEFTWAFDHMRREIIKARACEKEAIENNKTVIATLSHDIKTPISSIRTYAEAMDAGLDKDQERRRRYLSVLMSKCDEVTKLTNDLFLHSLSDLDKLKVETKQLPIHELMKKIVSELDGEQQDIKMNGILCRAEVELDEKRFEQVMENVINNARKYAGSRIDISTRIEHEQYIIKIRDYGLGVPEEDIPFLFDKFYRGHNTKEKQGSGLGLYIVHYIVGQMRGQVFIKNESPGLSVTIWLPIKKNMDS